METKSFVYQDQERLSSLTFKDVSNFLQANDCPNQCYRCRSGKFKIMPAISYPDGSISLNHPAITYLDIHDDTAADQVARIATLTLTCESCGLISRTSADRLLTWLDTEQDNAASYK